MKKIFSLCLILFLTFTLTSCKKDIILLDRPTNTNIQFWITENMESFNYKGYLIEEEKNNKIVFYGIDYDQYPDESGNYVMPKHYVKYTSSLYGVNDENLEMSITSIEITDLTIDIYGINLESSFKDFDKALKEAGFKITKKTRKVHVAEKENITISFYDNKILIIAEI